MNIDLLKKCIILKVEERFCKIYNHVAIGNKDNKVLRLNRSMFTSHFICIEAAYVKSIFYSLFVQLRIFCHAF